jgi:hypothetical protein
MIRSLAFGVVVATLVATARPALAEQPRDWILGAQPPGTDLMLDAILPGVQATVEHRIPIYEIANQLTLRANSLFLLPLYESQADVDLRLLVLTLGASAGFRDTFRNLTFAPGERIDRDHRRQRELDGRVSNEIWGFYEGRATLSLPFNDYLVFQGVNTLRFEGRPDRSYDWRTGVVHDGTFFRSDNMLFLKHRDWGGIAPIMQVLAFEDGVRNITQVNYGVALVTRPGARRRNDLLFVQVLFHPGKTFGDEYEPYGMHLLFSPIVVTVAYRAVLPIDRPD